MRQTSWTALAFVAASWMSAGWPCHAAGQVLPASLSPSGQSPAPVAFYRFCAEAPQECAPAPRARPFTITSERWDELVTVNTSVNSSLREMTDQAHYGVEDYWTLPLDGKGDCEDFAIAKRHALIERGWPPSRLLITAVLTTKGEGHAVLTVVTDRGDVILDNKRSVVLLWSETDYDFLARQSQTDPRTWVALSDDPGPATVATTTRRVK